LKGTKEENSKKQKTGKRYSHGVGPGESRKEKMKVNIVVVASTGENRKKKITS